VARDWLDWWTTHWLAWLAGDWLDAGDAGWTGSWSVVRCLCDVGLTTGLVGSLVGVRPVLLVERNWIAAVIIRIDKPK
jgi:hypothetical protein